MPEPWDAKIPGLDGAETGVPVDALCRGRVQHCPRCDAPVVWAFRNGAAGDIVAVNPIVDPGGNVVLDDDRPGASLWAYIAAGGQQATQPRHALHNCPNARPAPTRRRRPNGPTAR